MLNSVKKKTKYKVTFLLDKSNLWIEKELKNLISNSIKNIFLRYQKIQIKFQIKILYFRYLIQEYSPINF